MSVARWVVVVSGTTLLGLAGCGLGFDVPTGSAQLTPARKAATEQEVRQFVAAVSHDITQQGPAAWEKHFADSPAFFMADEGKLVFPNRQAATQAIAELTRTIKHMELTWGDDLRVDPLTQELAQVASSWREVTVDKDGHQVIDAGFFTGLAERHDRKWQFRNAHWSVAVPAKAP